MPFVESLIDFFLYLWVAATYPLQAEDWTSHLTKAGDTTRDKVLIEKATGLAGAALTLLLLGIAILSTGDLLGVLLLVGAPFTYLAGSILFLRAIWKHAEKGPYPEMNKEE